MLEVEHQALFAVVLDHEGLGDVVEAGRTSKCSCEEAAVALGCQPLAVLGLDPRDALVERLGRASRPVDANALADPAQHMRRGANLSPERDVLAHALLQCDEDDEEYLGALDEQLDQLEAAPDPEKSLADRFGGHPLPLPHVARRWPRDVNFQPQTCHYHPSLAGDRLNGGLVDCGT